MNMIQKLLKVVMAGGTDMFMHRVRTAVESLPGRLHNAVCSNSLVSLHTPTQQCTEVLLKSYTLNRPQFGLWPLAKLKEHFLPQLCPYNTHKSKPVASPGLAPACSEMWIWVPNLSLGFKVKDSTMHAVPALTKTPPNSGKMLCKAAPSCLIGGGERGQRILSILRCSGHKLQNIFQEKLHWDFTLVLKRVVIYSSNIYVLAQIEYVKSVL